MRQSSLVCPTLALPTLALAILAGCSCTNDPGDLPDVSFPDGSMPMDAPLGDGEVPPDGGRMDGGGTGPIEMTCPGAAAPSLASGVCEATAGDANLLITADVLVPGLVYRGGQVLLDASGFIACVGCDCSTSAGAATATRLECPDGVLSPGLVNAHEHISFQGDPYTDSGERYEHRHDWRRGIRGHTRIPSRMAFGEEMTLAEIRMAMGGVTSLNGSGSRDGFVRNLDRSAMEGLGQAQVEYDTFPLGDSSGTLLASGCSYGSGRTTAMDIASEEAYTPHVSEGIDAESRNEFLCMREGADDLIAEQTAIIHGIGLRPGEIEEIASDGAMLVWSPRSNVTLYGDTAQAPLYDRLGVPIALGTDWIFTGSMNLLRELQCADSLNADHWDGYFSDEELWLMATLNGASATGTDDVIGAIRVGYVGDLAIFDGRVHADHRAVIDAEPEDVALVLRGGVPLFGEASVVPLLRDGASCEAIDVCGAARQVCAVRETGMTVAALQAAVDGDYELFFCDTDPRMEPSCMPMRGTAVAGSTVYTGVASATDMDGDGIADTEDNCPSMFNPIRPLDEGAQGDADGDGEGDICDPCPLDADTTSCTTVDPNDRDRDMVPDDVDNCRGLANMDQADRDMDGRGDACDPCPDAPNPGGSACPATIYQVKTGEVATGSAVRVEGVVTAIGSNGFFMQVPTGSPDYVDANNSGIFVFTGGAPTIARGDAVAVDGTASVYFGEIQITAGSTTRTGAGTIPPAVDVTPAEVATGGSRAMALEGVLVRVSSVTVTNPMPAPGGGETAPTYEFEVTGNLRVDDFLFRLAPLPVMGESFTSITGVLAFRRDNSKLHPRDAADVVTGTPRLLSITPALSYARVGAGSVPTFPTPLTVNMTRAVGTDTVVTITAGVGLTVADVTVPAGMASAVVPVTATTASATPVTVTASFGGDSFMASVRALGATEMPTSFTLAPSMADLFVGVAQPFTVTLDVPAPPGGVMVTLGLSMPSVGTLPASVMVPADALSASFDLTGAMAGSATLTATALGGTMRTAAINVVAGVPGSLVINELDYDQAGSDNAEFIEIYNGSLSAVDLAGIQVLLINGSTRTAYTTVNLTGSLAAGEYLVIGVMGQTLSLPAGTQRIDIPSMSGGSIQNGMPDGVALWDSTTSTLLDALSYEGEITDAVISGTMVSLVAGTAFTTADVAGGSLGRIPNGQDTGDDSADWVLSSMPTPGAPNAASM